tara:strand:+ start:609 stop:1331 length:723 start_codon:yes stop_codon:yes gene_type:complete
MFKTPNVIIPVRLDSSRLPAKAMLRLTSDNTVIEHCIARCLEFGLSPVVATDRNSFQHLKYLSAKFDICVEWGPKNNKLKRLVQTAVTLKMPVFHIVDPDDPFFCPTRVMKSLSMVKTGLAIFPSVYSDQGGATEGYSFMTEDLLAVLATPDNLDTSMIQPHITFLEKNVIENPSFATKQTRLTLDYIEDYFYFLDLFGTFDHRTNREELELFILKNNMFGNVFLNHLWKQKQLSEMKND